MNKKILPVDVEKNKELFEYEMTQVILALKKTHEKNENITSPIKDFEINQGDVDKRPNFTPLPQKELEKQCHDIPDACVGMEYIPLADVKPSIKFENNAQCVSLADNTVSFIPLTEINASVVPIEMPKTEISIEYKSEVGSADISTHDIPVACVNIEYKATEPVSLDKLNHEVPAINTDIQYTPTEFVATSVYKQEVPKLEVINQYNPYTKIDAVEAHFAPPSVVSLDYVPINSGMTEISEQNIPNATITVPYTPYTMKEFERKSSDVPQTNTSLVFTSIVQASEIDAIDTPETKTSINFKPIKVKRKIKKIKCPTVATAQSYKPISPPYVKPIDVHTSNMSSSFNYEHMKKPDVNIPKIAVPTFSDVFEYKAVNSRVSACVREAIPKHDINITLENKPSVEVPTIHPLSSLSAEDIAPKDFFEMWMNA